MPEKYVYSENNSGGGKTVPRVMNTILFYISYKTNFF